MTSGSPDDRGTSGSRTNEPRNRGPRLSGNGGGSSEFVGLIAGLEQRQVGFLVDIPRMVPDATLDLMIGGKGEATCSD